jgi:GNAT superfamily N-acetyltransferase
MGTRPLGVELDEERRMRLRTAGADDAEQVALLHADSWRRHYRGAYSDSFLDGDVAADRRSVWSARLSTPADAETVHNQTILAENDDRLLGFIHVIFDDDPRWGSLVDNLHVVHDQRRTGVGSQLLAGAASAVTKRARGNGFYLWVLEQNTQAQQFYRRSGGALVETAPVPPPGGDPNRLMGNPRGLRIAWPDASRVGRS